MESLSTKLYYIDKLSLTQIPLIYKDPFPITPLLSQTSANFNDYTESRTYICQLHCLQNSTVNLTDYRKHTNTHLPASLTTELNCQPHCLQYTQIHLPASLTTEYTNTSASLTDYRTQLPISRITGNTQTHICQPH